MIDRGLTDRRDNLRGAILMMASMAAFTVNDTFVKLLSAEMSLFQVVFLRGLATTFLLLGAAAVMGALRTMPSARDNGLIALRALTEVAAAWFFLRALFNLPLATVTAILQVMPLAVTLAGAVFLREPVGWRRLLAIVIGFGGVMLIIRPGAEGFNPFALSALAAVACVTARDLITRRLSPTVPSMLVAVVTAAAVTVFGALGSLTQPWAPVGGISALFLAGAVICLMIGYSLSIMVMRVGDVAFVAPFRYSSLVFATVLGIAVFAHWPDVLTLIGGAIVVGTGIFTFYREARLRRRNDQLQAGLTGS